MPLDSQPKEMVQYDFEGRKVYIIDWDHAIMDESFPVYDAQGEIICTLGGYAGETECLGKDFGKTATNRTVVWSRKTAS